MTVYAIRHKPTGGYLPAHARNGHTWNEPTPIMSALPRLFLKESSAKKAMAAWLQGHYKQKSAQDSMHGECDVWVEPDPVPERKAEDMEIVKFQLWTKRN